MKLNNKSELRVSVCMATFNGALYIERQLESILSQLHLCDEVIIVDDCSEDSTVNLVEKIGDFRISIFRNHINFGVQKSFEKAINLASGDIIFLSDQDDVWLDGKIDAIKYALINHDLVVTDCIVTDQELNVSFNSLFKLREPKLGLINNIFRNSYTGCCMAFNRKVLKAALPFPKNIPMHDWWIGLVGELVGSVHFIEKPFILYRRHSLNSSSLTKPSKYSFLKQVSMRWNLLINLFKKFVLKT